MQSQYTEPSPRPPDLSSQILNPDGFSERDDFSEDDALDVVYVAD